MIEVQGSKLASSRGVLQRSSERDCSRAAQATATLMEESASVVSIGQHPQGPYRACMCLWRHCRPCRASMRGFRAWRGLRVAACTSRRVRRSVRVACCAYRGLRVACRGLRVAARVASHLRATDSDVSEGQSARAAASASMPDPTPNMLSSRLSVVSVLKRARTLAAWCASSAAATA